MDTIQQKQSFKGGHYVATITQAINMCTRGSDTLSPCQESLNTQDL